MRRYRVARFMIDGTRGTLTNEKIPAEHKEHIIERIKEGHGTDDHEAKLKRYLDLKPPNFMVVPDYVNILNEIRDSYVSGYLYAGLTASCCLGERILNTLIINLRDYYKKRRQYNWAKRSDSFTDWKQCIDTLLEWKVFSNDNAKDFRDLLDIRHASIHFDKLLDIEARSLIAVNLILKITNDLFGVNDLNFFWTPGVPFVRKNREKEPVVREFILPNCAFVTYNHTVELGSEIGKMILRDDPSVPDKDVTDEEFIELVKKFRQEE